MTDTERLDFMFRWDVKFQGFTGGKKGDYYEMDVWDGPRHFIVEGKTQRDCIDGGIEREKRGDW
jgi:hypothetical protein